MNAALLNVGLLLAAPVLLQEDGAAPRPHTDVMRGEADAVSFLVETELGAKFLAAVSDLPSISPRTLRWDRASGAALTPAAWAKLGEAERAAFDEHVFDERRYYETFYGTPVAYVRAFDLAAKHGFEADGARVLDFGYGGIGHLRILASLGADVVGVEVMELLDVLYSEPGDTGEIARAASAGEGERGRLTLVHGRFPAEETVTAAVGGGYSLVVSKNVLKKGYVHPEREADPSRLVHLGVDDATFVRAVHDALRPGGLFVIYNLYPRQAPDDQPYLPWATGGCPFDRELMVSSGFEVLDFDRDDTAAARDMGHALGWGDEMDLEASLFGMVTVLRRAP
jgi:SAM-dependent methyltransferase